MTARDYGDTWVPTIVYDCNYDKCSNQQTRINYKDATNVVEHNPALSLCWCVDPKGLNVGTYGFAEQILDMGLIATSKKKLDGMRGKYGYYFTTADIENFKLYMEFQKMLAV